MPRHDRELVPTRASLLHRLRDWDDKSSWQEFFDTYWRLIYGLARKMGLNDAEAQDVVQETMTSVAKHMPAFRYDPVIGSFKAWLFKLTRWRIVGQFRKRGPLAAHISIPGETVTGTDPLQNIVDPSGEALDAMWNAEWETNLLRAAVDNVKRRLDPEKYQIFDFYVNKGWPPEKVAATFRISVGQVYLAKTRITAMIRKEVKRLEKEMT
jgi:RNA polymerase sigma factor (sigma-70 family)